MKLYKDDYIELSLDWQAEKSLEQQARQFFKSCRIPSSHIVCFTSPRRKRLSIFLTSKLKAQKISSLFKLQSVTGLRLKSKVLARDEWLDDTERPGGVRKLGTTFRVIPVGTKKTLKQKDILLKTSQVFGSGEHPTTQMCAQLLEKYSAPMKTVLDAGTGTGVLSIVAARSGALCGVGIDRDRSAVRSARANLTLNGIGGWEIRRGDASELKAEGRFDLVIANLPADVLKKCLPSLRRAVARRGGLVISGVHDFDLNEYRQSFKSKKLRCRKHLRLRGWHAFLYKSS